MRASGRERGQAALEYLGLLVLVAAVVVALTTFPVGDRIARALGCAVNSVAGGGEGAGCRNTEGSDGTGADGGNDSGLAADGSNQSGKQEGTGGRGVDGLRAGDGGSDNNGPQKPAGDHPTAGPALESAPADIPVLPFPVRTSVQIEANNRGVNMSVQEVLSRTEPVTKLARIDTNEDDKPDKKVLRDSVTLEVTGEVEVSASVGVDGRRVGASASTGEGTSSTYKIKVPPKVADQIASGKRDAPNPFNPYSIPIGGSALLGKDTYSQLGMELQYRVLRLESEVEEGKRVATGVQRIGEHKVRVFTGTASFVRNATSLGLGTDMASIGFMLQNNQSKGKMSSRTFDLSTKAGRQAYREFIKTGKLPPPGSPGVVATAQLERTKWSEKSSIHGNLFDVEIDLPLGSKGMTYTSKLHGDGSRTNAYTYRIGDITMTTTTKSGPKHSGQRVVTTGLVLENVDPELANAYTKEQGLGNPHYTKPQDVYIEYSARELNEIQDQVYAFAARECRSGAGCQGVPEHVDTAAEVEKYLENNPPGRFEGPAFYYGSMATRSSLRRAVARADEPQEILAALVREGIPTGSGNDKLRQLNSLAIRPNDRPGVPGEIAAIKPSQ